MTRSLIYTAMIPVPGKYWAPGGYMSEMNNGPEDGQLLCFYLTTTCCVAWGYCFSTLCLISLSELEGVGKCLVSSAGLPRGVNIRGSH